MVENHFKPLVRIDCTETLYRRKTNEMVDTWGVKGVRGARDVRDA